jgi:uncharacterized membrane protein YphA (DoxX/SURF4 family)
MASAKAQKKSVRKPKGQGSAQLKALTWVLRILVGGLFVFSGFVKVNDVVGFATKLDKYWFAFEKAIGLNFSALTEVSVPVAFAFSAFEVLLGIFLLLGILRGFTTVSLFLMIIFFTFLTGWAAITKSVPDCGCFGDAFTIPPWTSFMKDVILVVLTGALYIYRDDIQPLLKGTYAVTGATVASSVLVLGFTFYTLQYEPVWDTRACKVGNNFEQIVDIDLNTGVAALPDYNPIEGDCQGATIGKGKVLLVLMKDMEAVTTRRMQQVVELTDNLLAAGVQVYGISATSPKIRKEIAESQGLKFCISTQDQDLIKTCMRNNPAFLLLQDGKIVIKWSAAGVPDAQGVLAQYR